MQTTTTANQTIESLERFRRSTFRAQLADLLALISGSSQDLMQYDTVAKRLRARQQVAQGTELVPLDQIVGSVGRYKDFTRTFLPRGSVNAERWARVDAALNSLEGLPPVELFKIGAVYFVRDGNHRISVARANGVTHIEAYVTEVATNIPLTQEDFDRDLWLIKIEHAEFLEASNMEHVRPEADIRFTEPGRYAILMHHIEVHKYLRDLELGQNNPHYQPLSWDEAVASWYDTVYMPVVQAIRQYELLQRFPKRTEADLYLWIALHRETLAQHYELAPLSPKEAVATFAETHSEQPWQHALQEMRMSWYRTFGNSNLPPGMSEEEFQQLRERRQAGEVSLSEADHQRLDGDATGDSDNYTIDTMFSGNATSFGAWF